MAKVVTKNIVFYAYMRNFSYFYWTLSFLSIKT